MPGIKLKRATHFSVQRTEMAKMVKKQRKASPRNEQKWIFQGVSLKNVGPKLYITLLIEQVISETAGSLGGQVVSGGGKFFFR